MKNCLLEDSKNTFITPKAHVLEKTVHLSRSKLDDLKYVTLFMVFI